jgi:hypothetical protein
MRTYLQSAPLTPVFGAYTKGGALPTYLSPSAIQPYLSSSRPMFEASEDEPLPLGTGVAVRGLLVVELVPVVRMLPGGPSAFRHDHSSARSSAPCQVLPGIVTSVAQGGFGPLSGHGLGLFQQGQQLGGIVWVLGHLGGCNDEPAPWRHLRIQGGHHRLGIVPGNNALAALHQGGSPSVRLTRSSPSWATCCMAPRTCSRSLWSWLNSWGK